NRAMVPSLPLLLVCPVIVRPATLKLARPRMPSASLAGTLFDWLASSALSGICSIRPAPKNRRRDAEDHVAVQQLGREVRLRHRARAGAVSPGDGEERVHAAVGRAVPIADEPGFADRPVRGDE